MQHTATLAATCAFPLEALDNLQVIQTACRARYMPLGEDEAVVIDGCYTDAGMLHVPRQYGIDLAAQLGFELVDETSLGYHAEYSPSKPPREYQNETLAALLAATDEYHDVVFRAHTGWGKTYGALWLGSQLKRTTLIVVDQDNLEDQWETTAMKCFGLARDEIGHVRGPVEKWDGYAVTIATVQTLSQKRYSSEFYSYFGLIVLDEVHTIGAPTFGQVLFDFSAATRLGVSATPKRKDALEKLLRQHLGPVRVAADKEHEASAVYFVRNHNTYSWYANTSRKLGRLLTEVAEDAMRNLQLAELIQWLDSTGRDVLVLSDRTEQMRHLSNLCYYLGMEEETLGLYTGETPVPEYKKNPHPMRLPVGLARDEHGQPAPFTPVSLQLISKKIPSRALKYTKENSRHLFATYGKAAKGFDEPRLCGGVDATPRSAAEQIHGRILRGGAAKPPIWVTTLDWNNPRLLKSFAARITDFVKSNGEIYEWLEEGGLQPWQPDELIDVVQEQLRKISSLRIETNSEGRYTLMTPLEAMRNAPASRPTTRASTRHSTGSAVASSRRGPFVKSSTQAGSTTSRASPSVRRLSR